MALLEENQYRAWKTNLVPLLYDWLSNHHLMWPSQTCRWGRVLEEKTYKWLYRMYLSEQTDGSEPNKLLVMDMEICKPHVASAETCSCWQDYVKTPYIKNSRVIYHPGEVNKIRDIPQVNDLVVTHTDAPELYVWHLPSQPSRAAGSDGAYAGDSVPDLILSGHKGLAQFPVATTHAAPLVGSGGTDTFVLLWDLADQVQSWKNGASKPSPGKDDAPTLKARDKLKGHESTVEDLVFKPHSEHQLVSVGDDHQILFWDVRDGKGPVCRVRDAHLEHDLQCVDWSGLNDYMVATGAADGSLKVWDHRKLSTDPGKEDCLFSVKHHTGGILRVEWHPAAPGVLASGGEDQMIMVWDLNKRAGEGDSRRLRSPGPSELIFTHLGHRHGKVVDFQWCPSAPWTMLSVSENLVDDDDTGTGGGTLQVWRMTDFIYLPEDQCMSMLEEHKDFVLHGKNPPKGKSKEHTTNKRTPTKAPPPPTTWDGPQPAKAPTPPPPPVETKDPEEPTAHGPEEVPMAEGAIQDANGEAEAVPSAVEEQAIIAAEELDETMNDEIQPEVEQGEQGITGIMLGEGVGGEGEPVVEGTTLMEEEIQAEVAEPAVVDAMQVEEIMQLPLEEVVASTQPEATLVDVEVAPVLQESAEGLAVVDVQGQVDVVVGEGEVGNHMES